MRDVFDMETTKERIEYIKSLSEVDVYLQLLWALGELKELRDRLQVYEDEEISINLEGTYEVDEKTGEVLFDEEEDTEDFDEEEYGFISTEEYFNRLDRSLE